MKIRVLFKQLVLAFLLIFALLLALKPYARWLHATFKIPPMFNHSDRFLVINIFTPFIWLIYTSLKNSYKTLKRTPTLWLVFLLITAGICSLEVSLTMIHYIRLYVPFLLQRDSLSTCLAFAPLGMLNVIFSATPCYITYLSLKALIQQK